MMLRMFTILDVKADAYSAPFFKPSVGLALRDFSDLVNDRSTTPGRHPEDFKLIEIGAFDDQTGTGTFGEPVSLGFGTEYVERGDSGSVRKVG